MTQAQQPEALRIAMHLRSRAQISSAPGNLDTLSASAANELERQHARILELEQGKCLNQIAEPAVVAPWKDHRTAALVNDLRECAKTYANTEQLRERIATIVAPLCDQLKAAEHAATSQALPATRTFNSQIFGPTRDACEAELAAIAAHVAATPVAVFQALNRTLNTRGLLITIGSTMTAAAAAAPAEGVPAQAFKTKVFQALGIGSACDEHVVFVNIENLRRRADCLSAIEREFFMVETPPDESEGDLEPGEECLLNWAHSPEQYVKQFAEALAATPPAALGLDARIYTYKNQPTDNVVAWRFGEACANAKPGGDYIDRGLSLLQQLEQKGYGLVELAAQAKQGGADHG